MNTGALGCLLLLVRTAWSIPILGVSVVCIVVQMGYSTFMTDAMEIYGVGVAAQGALITAIGVVILWYARRAKETGWIS